MECQYEYENQADVSFPPEFRLWIGDEDIKPPKFAPPPTNPPASPNDFTARPVAAGSCIGESCEFRSFLR